MEPVTLKYSEHLVRRAIRAYWWRNLGLVFPSASLLLTVFVIYRALNGDRSWSIGVIGAIVIIAFSVMAASYFIHLRRSLARLNRMKTPEATLELGVERLKVASDVGALEMQWSLIKQIWCFEHAWLVFFSGSEFMTLPTDGLPDEAKAIIIDRAKENGAKIV